MKRNLDVEHVLEQLREKRIREGSLQEREVKKGQEGQVGRGVEGVRQQQTPVVSRRNPGQGHSNS